MVVKTPPCLALLQFSGKALNPVSVRAIAFGFFVSLATYNKVVHAIYTGSHEEKRTKPRKQQNTTEDLENPFIATKVERQYSDTQSRKEHCTIKVGGNWGFMGAESYLTVQTDNCIATVGSLLLGPEVGTILTLVSGIRKDMKKWRNGSGVRGQEETNSIHENCARARVCVSVSESVRARSRLSFRAHKLFLHKKMLSMSMSWDR